MSANEKKVFYKRLSMIVPAFILFSLFVIYPFVSGLFYSFTDWDGLTVTKYVGFDNFKRLFQDRNFIKAGIHTFALCAAIIFVGNPVAILIAMLLNLPLKNKGILRTAFYIPNILSFVVISVLWTLILKYDGVINYILDFLNLSSLKLDWIGNMETVLPAVIFISIWATTGTSIIIYIAGLSGIPKEIYEAATIDGAKVWMKFRHITIPLLMPAITICMFLGLTGGLKMFDLPYIMTQGGPAGASTTVALVIYDYAFKGMLYGYATAAGVVFLLVILLVSFLQLNFTRKREVEY